MQKLHEFYDDDGQEYQVPDTELDEFKSVMPNATKAHSFTDGKDTYRVPDTELDEFKSVLPDAQEVSWIQRANGERILATAANRNELYNQLRTSPDWEEDRKAIRDRVEKLVDPQESAFWRDTATGVGLHAFGRGVVRDAPLSFVKGAAVGLPRAAIGIADLITNFFSSSFGDAVLDAVLGMASTPPKEEQTIGEWFLELSKRTLESPHYRGGRIGRAVEKIAPLTKLNDFLTSLQSEDYRDRAAEIAGTKYQMTYSMADKDGNVVNVPHAQVQKFAKDNPDAVIVQRFTDATGKEYLVSPDETEEFLKIVPDAKERFGVLDTVGGETLSVDNESLARMLRKPGAGVTEALQKLGAPEVLAGFGGHVAALAAAPDVLGHQTIEGLPAIMAAGAFGRAAAPALVRLGVNPQTAAMVAAGVGEGLTVAGRAHETARAADPEGATTLKQTGLSVASGLTVAAIGAAARVLGDRLGMSGVDIEASMARGHTGRLMRQNMATRMISAGLWKGGVEDMPQAVVEKMLENVALDLPLDEGLEEVAAMAFTRGMVTGALANIQSVPDRLLPRRAMEAAGLDTDNLVDNIVRTGDGNAAAAGNVRGAVGRIDGAIETLTTTQDASGKTVARTRADMSRAERATLNDLVRARATLQTGYGTFVTRKAADMLPDVKPRVLGLVERAKAGDTTAHQELLKAESDIAHIVKNLSEMSNNKALRLETIMPLREYTKLMQEIEGGLPPAEQAKRQVGRMSARYQELMTAMEGRELTKQESAELNNLKASIAKATNDAQSARIRVDQSVAAAEKAGADAVQFAYQKAGQMTDADVAQVNAIINQIDQAATDLVMNRSRPGDGLQNTRLSDADAITLRDLARHRKSLADALESAGHRPTPQAEPPQQRAARLLDQAASPDAVAKVAQEGSTAAVQQPTPPAQAPAPVAAADAVLLDQAGAGYAADAILPPGVYRTPDGNTEVEISEPTPASEALEAMSAEEVQSAPEAIDEALDDAPPLEQMEDLVPVDEAPQVPDAEAETLTGEMLAEPEVSPVEPTPEPTPAPAPEAKPATPEAAPDAAKQAPAPRAATPLSKKQKGYLIGEARKAYVSLNGQKGTGLTFEEWRKIQLENLHGEGKGSTSKLTNADMDVSLKHFQNIAHEAAKRQAEIEAAKQPPPKPVEKYVPPPRPKHADANISIGADFKQEWQSVTPQGNMRVKGVWRVVDAAGLTTSNQEGYFSPAAQERDRDTESSKQQIANIATYPDPTRLAQDAQTDGGAPIVWSGGGKMHVVSGNGRVAGLRQAYEGGTAQDYGAMVDAVAAELGVDTSGMAAPVLVREATGLDKDGAIELGQLSNKVRTLQMTAAEKAVADGQMLVSQGLISIFNPDESGSIRAASNNEFLRRFIELSGDESLRNKDGSFSPEIDNRVRNAILYATLANTADGRTVARNLVEDHDRLGLKRQMDGILAAASDLLRVYNSNPDYSLREPLTAALVRLVDYKNQKNSGASIGDFANFAQQQDMFRQVDDDSDAALADQLALILFEAKSVKQVHTVLSNYARLARQQIPAAESLFEESVAQKRSTLLTRATEVGDEVQQEEFFSGEVQPDGGKEQRPASEVAGRGGEAGGDKAIAEPATPPAEAQPAVKPKRTAMPEPKSKAKAKPTEAEKADGVTRAVAGGQMGINDFFYKGGQFLPNTPAEPGTWRLKRKDGKWVDATSGKKEIAPYTWQTPPSPASSSIFKLLDVGGATKLDDNGKVVNNERLREDLRPNFNEQQTMWVAADVKAQETYSMNELMDAYNKGMRWLNLTPSNDVEFILKAESDTTDYSKLPPMSPAAEAEKAVKPMLPPAKSKAKAEMEAKQAQAEQGADEGLKFSKRQMLPEPKSAKAADQTQTPAFKKWFGESKVVDREGKPLVVAHSTDREFSVFRNMQENDAGWLGAGYYFFGDRSLDGQYGRNIIEAYIKVENPYYATDKDMESLAEANDPKASREFTERLKNEGYDGVYYNGNLNQEWVVFTPNQIKSATENIGTFSAKTDDIRFSRRRIKDAPGQQELDLDFTGRRTWNHEFQPMRGRDMAQTPAGTRHLAEYAPIRLQRAGEGRPFISTFEPGTGIARAADDESPRAITPAEARDVRKAGDRMNEMMYASEAAVEAGAEDETQINEHYIPGALPHGKGLVGDQWAFIPSTDPYHNMVFISELDKINPRLAEKIVDNFFDAPIEQSSESLAYARQTFDSERGLLLGKVSVLDGWKAPAGREDLRFAKAQAQEQQPAADVPAEKPPKGITVQELRQAANRRHGDTLKALERNGHVVVEQTTADAVKACAERRAKVRGGSPQQIAATLRRAMGGEDSMVAEGFYDPVTKTSFIIADYVEPSRAGAVIMHEIGIHAANDGAFKALFADAFQMINNPGDDVILQRAAEKFHDAGETTGEEAAAYIAAEYEQAQAEAGKASKSWWSRFIDAIRAWLVKKGVLRRFKPTSAADVAAVARANSRSLAKVGAEAGGELEAQEGATRAAQRRTKMMPEPKRSIVGQRAKGVGTTAVAERMEKQGADRKAIWQQTGWWRGYDGKWRFEIDPSEVRVNTRGVAETTSAVRLSDVLDFPELYKAYPRIGNTKTLYVIDKDTGYHNARLDTWKDDSGTYGLAKGDKYIHVYTSSEGRLRSALIHETQHMVQNQENFAKGGSVETLSTIKDINALLGKQLREHFKEYGFEQWAENLVLSDPGRYQALLDAGKESTSLMPMYEAFAKDNGLSETNTRLFTRTAERLSKEANKTAKISAVVGLDGAYTAYRKLAGETEARLVQRRLDMTAAERKSEPPWVSMEKMLKEEGLLKEGQTAADVLLGLDQPEAGVKFSKVRNKQQIAKLDKEETFKGYRSMQMDGGKIYPFKGRFFDGKEAEPSEMGKWEQSVENPHLADDKGLIDLKSNVGWQNVPVSKVAYAPYLHARENPLNIQFSAAWRVPQAVVMEVEIPKSEMDGTYQAEKSKKKTGMSDWDGGDYQRYLDAGDQGQVSLSRWHKPVRVLSHSEVADRILPLVKKIESRIPGNKVGTSYFQPQLRAELEARGIKFYDNIDVADNAANRKAKAAYEKAYQEAKAEIAGREQQADALKFSKRRDSTKEGAVAEELIAALDDGDSILPTLTEKHGFEMIAELEDGEVHIEWMQNNDAPSGFVMRVVRQLAQKYPVRLTPLAGQQEDYYKRNGFVRESPGKKDMVLRLDGETLKFSKRRMLPEPKSRANTKTEAPATTPERDLVATHNLSADNLRHAVEMGGIPVPSLAVTKKGGTISSFGEITLVGRKDIADPRQGAKVFGADIYSTRYPQIKRTLSARDYDRFYDRFHAADEKIGNISYLERSKIEWNRFQDIASEPAMMAMFMDTKDIKPEVVKQKPLVDGAELARWQKHGLDKFATEGVQFYDLQDDKGFQDAVKAYTLEQFDEHKHLLGDNWEEGATSNMSRRVAAYAKETTRGVQADRSGTQTAMEAQIKKAGLQEEYAAFVRNEISRITRTERVRGGETPSGETRYLPHTLENVVRLMKREMRGGEGGSFGAGMVRAHVTPQFRSVTEIRKAKQSLTSKEAMDAIRDETNNELSALAMKLNVDAFSIESFLADVVKYGVKRAAQMNGKEVDDEGAAAISGFLDKLRNLPTEYFEVKVPRVVQLNDFAAAVVPDDASEVTLKLLRDGGITEIHTYKARDEADRKQVTEQAAEAQADEILFSKRRREQIERDQATGGDAAPVGSGSIPIGDDAETASFLAELTQAVASFEELSKRRIEITQAVEQGVAGEEAAKGVAAEMKRLKRRDKELDKLRAKVKASGGIGREKVAKAYDKIIGEPPPDQMTIHGMMRDLEKRSRMRARTRPTAMEFRRLFRESLQDYAKKMQAGQAAMPTNARELFIARNWKIHNDLDQIQVNINSVPDEGTKRRDAAAFHVRKLMGLDHEQWKASGFDIRTSAIGPQDILDAARDAVERELRAHYRQEITSLFGGRPVERVTKTGKTIKTRTEGTLRKTMRTMPAELKQQAHAIIDGIDFDNLKGMEVSDMRDVVDGAKEVLAHFALSQEIISEAHKVRRAEASEKVAKEIIAGREKTIKDSEVVDPKHGTMAQRDAIWNRTLGGIGELLAGGNPDSLTAEIIGTKTLEANEGHLHDEMVGRKAMDAKLAELGFTKDDVRAISYEPEMVTLADGRKVQLLRSEMMTLYGMTLDDDAGAKAVANGFLPSRLQGQIEKSLIQGQAEDYEARLEATAAIIESITSRLTSREKALVEWFVDEVNPPMAVRMNETSMRVNGREIADPTKRHFSLAGSVKRDVVTPEVTEAAFNFQHHMVENSGIAHERQAHSHPLMLRDFFAVYRQHIRDQAVYNNWSVIFRDVQELVSRGPAHTEIVARWGKDAVGRIKDVLLLTTKQRGYTDRHNALQRFSGWAESKLSVYILGLRLTSFLANRWQGGTSMAGQFAADGEYNAAAKVALDLVKPLGLLQRTKFNPERQAIMDWLLEDGYLSDRWEASAYQVFAQIASVRAEVEEARKAGSISKRRLQQHLDMTELSEKLLYLMAYAEKTNAIDAYEAALKTGLTPEEARLKVSRMTRRTQNPSTELEHTGFYSDIRYAGLGLLMPFMGAPTVIGNDIRTRHARKQYHKRTGDKKKAKQAARAFKAVVGFSALGALLVALARALFRTSRKGGPHNLDEEGLKKEGIYLALDVTGELLQDVSPAFGDLAISYGKPMVNLIARHKLLPEDQSIEFGVIPDYADSIGDIISLGGKIISGEDLSDAQTERLIWAIFSVGGGTLGAPLGGVEQVGKAATGLIRGGPADRGTTKRKTRPGVMPAPRRRK